MNHCHLQVQVFVPVALLGKFRWVIIDILKENFDVNLRKLLWDDANFFRSHSDRVHIGVPLVVQRIRKRQPTSISIQDKPLVGIP